MSGGQAGNLKLVKMFLSAKCCLRRLLTRVENRALVSCRCDPIQTDWMMSKRGERTCLILKQTQYHCQICLIHSFVLFSLIASDTLSDKSNHCGCSLLKGTNMFHYRYLILHVIGTSMYLQDTNRHPLGINKVQRCTFLRYTAPVTAFVPFFCECTRDTFEDQNKACPSIYSSEF